MLRGWRLGLARLISRSSPAVLEGACSPVAPDDLMIDISRSVCYYGSHVARTRGCRKDAPTLLAQKATRVLVTLGPSPTDCVGLAGVFQPIRWRTLVTPNRVSAFLVGFPTGAQRMPQNAANWISVSKRESGRGAPDRSDATPCPRTPADFSRTLDANDVGTTIGEKDEPPGQRWFLGVELRGFEPLTP
jgi:hypothetical protein